MSTSQNLVPGEWHHVAVSYDGSLAKMYIDGNLEVSTNFSFSPSSTPLVISNISNCPFCATLGNMRDVAFFDQVLNDVEVADLYSSVLQPTQLSSIVAFYHCLQGLVQQRSMQRVLGWMEASKVAFGKQPVLRRILMATAIQISEDCNDNDSSIHPYAGDVYADGVDSDCDGFDCEVDTMGMEPTLVCV